MKMKDLQAHPPGLLSEYDVPKVRKMIRNGATVVELAQEFGVSVDTIYRFGKRFGLHVRTTGHGLAATMKENANARAV